MAEDDDVQIIEESNEEKAESKKGQGNKLYKSNDFNTAIKVYTESIELHPSAAVFANRSQCYLKLGDFQSAIKDAQAAISTDPTYVKGYLKMVKCHISLGNIEKARATLDEASKYDQKNVSPSKTSNNRSKSNNSNSNNISHSNEISNERKVLQELDKLCALVDSNWDKKDWRAVIYYCSKILDISPEFTSYKIKKAEAQILHKQYSLGQKTVIDVLRGDSKNVDAIYVRGLALYFLGDTDKAYDHFRQALTLSPDHVKSLNYIKKIKEVKLVKEQAVTLLNSNRPREALAAYEKALNIDSSNDLVNSKLHFNQAVCHSKLGDTKASLKSINRALELDPDYQKAKMKRVQLNIELEEYEEAVREAEQIYKRDTNESTKSLLDSAKQALKRSKQKDYYKMLGLGKSASEDEIKKAYKRLALTHHPDRHASASEEDRKLHEKKFKEIGEAYEILSDPKKKARYDSGADMSSSGDGFSADPNDLFSAFFASTGGFGGHPFFSTSSGHHGPFHSFNFSNPN